jgi:hypothetical protein
MLPDLDRAERIGEFWSYPQSCAFAKLLIDCEEDRTLRGGARRDAAGRRVLGSLLGTQREPRPHSEPASPRGYCAGAEMTGQCISDL